MEEPISMKAKIFTEVQRCFDGTVKAAMLFRYLFEKASWNCVLDCWTLEDGAAGAAAAAVYPEDCEDKKQGETDNAFDQRLKRAEARVRALKKDCKERLASRYNEQSFPDRISDVWLGKNAFILFVKPRRRLAATDKFRNYQLVIESHSKLVEEEICSGSDLIYLFASAPNLKRADEQIKSAMSEIRQPTYSLYRTFGSSDLVLRVRISGISRDAILNIKAAIKMQSPSKCIAVPMRWEFNSHGIEQRQRTSRRVFDPDGYDESGYQRAFIRLESSGTDMNLDKRGFVEDMFNRIKDEDLTAIVQSVAFGEAYAVIETLTHWSETLLLHQLSRLLDDAVLASEVQKETYLCYKAFEALERPDDKVCGSSCL